VLESFRRERVGNIAVSSVTASELTFGVIKSGSERNRQARAMLLCSFRHSPVRRFRDLALRRDQERSRTARHTHRLNRRHDRRPRQSARRGAGVEQRQGEFSSVDGLMLENRAEASSSICFAGLFLLLAPTLRSPMNQARRIMLLLIATRLTVLKNGKKSIFTAASQPGGRRSSCIGCRRHSPAAQQSIT